MYTASHLLGGHDKTRYWQLVLDSRASVQPRGHKNQDVPTGYSIGNTGRLIEIVESLVGIGIGGCQDICRVHLCRLPERAVLGRTV